MNKSELRKAAILQRKSLSVAELHHLSLKLLEEFSALDFSSVQTLHLFLPIEGKKEPDTFLFIDWIKEHQPGINLLVPRADFDTALMTNHMYTHRGDLQKNRFNILEPQLTEVHSGKIDMVLVPLLAFDRCGYRVGYGKGFYDRFLSGIKTRKIGLSLFDATEKIDDVDAYDIQLDQCITPEKTYDFKHVSGI